MLKNGSEVQIQDTLITGKVIGGVYGESLQFLVEYIYKGETLQKYCEADTLIELNPGV